MSSKSPGDERSLKRTLLRLLGLIALASGVALWVRYRIVEPEAVAAACKADDDSFTCWLRSVAVFGFARNVFALLSLACGLLALVTRARWLAAVAVTVGVIGSVLYRFELAGIGLLLGAMVLARDAPARQQNARRQQHA